MHRHLSSSLATLAVVAAVVQPAFARDQERCAPFEELTMTLERNETDGDTEVVFFAQGGDEGLARLTIVAPDGRRVAMFAGDRKGIGIREFVLESAEPPDLDRVLRSFPEGTYSFHGRTVGGDCLRGEAELSHQLAPATILLAPAANAVVPVGQVELRWQAVAGAARYVLELNNETLGTRMSFDVLPPTTSLAIPAALLAAASEYQFQVGVRMPDGNLTTVELTFFTAP